MLILARAAPAAGGEPGPAVEVTAIQPDRQVLAVLDLFDGSPWPHPAAVLADWKRAAEPGAERSLGKTLEALIAAINPLTARELTILDGARFALAFDSDGRPHWSLIAPGDDGTIAAIGTALALTDGAAEPPEGAFRVDRLGPPGAPLLAGGGEGGPAILASDRRALAGVLRRGLPGPIAEAAVGSGWIVKVKPAALAGAEATVARQIGAAIIGLGYGTIEATVALEGETLEVVIDGLPGDGPSLPISEPIDPRWLDPVPIDRVSAVVSLAVGPGGAAWGAAIDAADRIERLDPERADVAPLGSRLALLAIARGVRLDLDLWPNLEGLTAWVSLGDTGEIDGALIALHAPDEASAARIADRVVAGFAGAGGEEASAVAPGAIRSFGPVAGRMLTMTEWGSSVLVGWGDGVLEASLAAANDPGRSAGPVLRANWGARPPSRFAAAWPGRLAGSLGAEGPLRAALRASTPVIWFGRLDGEGPRDVLRWPDLRASVRAFLDRLAVEPLPRDDEPGRLAPQEPRR